MKKCKNGFELVIIALTMVCLIIFLTINLSPLYYWFAIWHFHLNQVSKLSSASLMRCYFFMLRYLQVPWDNHLNLIYFKSSSAGLYHFMNVKDLVVINNICLLVSGSFSINIIRYMYLRNLLWELINPIRIGMSALLILMSIALINFQSFFINFHRFIFRNQDWVFKVHLDPVIQVLPLGFFAGCFVIFISIFIISLGLIIHILKKLLTS